MLSLPRLPSADLNLLRIHVSLQPNELESVLSTLDAKTPTVLILETGVHRVSSSITLSHPNLSIIATKPSTIENGELTLYSFIELNSDAIFICAPAVICFTDIGLIGSQETRLKRIISKSDCGFGVTSVLSVFSGAKMHMRYCSVTCRSACDSSPQYPNFLSCCVLTEGLLASTKLTNCILTAPVSGAKGLVSRKQGVACLEGTIIKDCGSSALWSEGKSSLISASMCWMHATGGYGSCYALFGGRLELIQCTVSNATLGYGIMSIHEGSFVYAKQCCVTGCHWQGVAARWSGSGHIEGCCLGGNGLSGAWGCRMSTLSRVERLRNDVNAIAAPGCGFHSSTPSISSLCPAVPVSGFTASAGKTSNADQNPRFQPIVDIRFVILFDITNLCFFCPFI